MVTCPSCGATQRRSGIRSPGTILGSYRLLELLGEGGMGVVYLAEHTRLGRRVALKTLRTDFAENPQAVRRFFGEARAVNKIRHQNIVEITDFVEEPGGDNYYIMELLRGTPLSRVIDDEGIQPLARSVNIMAQVARALQAVHDAGIIHRDLKPDNVFLIERSGQPDFVKLLDFGVAKLIDNIENIGMHTTAAGAILGTPEYMSPEQASGKAVDHRTDIYSFGIMMYELVTGVLPLRGANFGELVVKHLTITPTPPTRVANLPHVVPPELEDAILACMEKDEDGRPDRIDTVADQLEKIAEANGWELPTYTAIPRSSTRMNTMQSGPHVAASSSGPIQITPLRRTPPAGTPVLGHAPTLEITPGSSSPRIDVTAKGSGSDIPTLPVVPPAKRWPLYVAIGALIAAASAFIAVTFTGGSEAPIERPPVAAPASALPQAPAPAVPTDIEIEIESTPSGADVVRLSDSKVLGQTPLTVPFPRSPDGVEKLELRLAGHVTQPITAKLDRGTRISTVMVGEATPAPSNPPVHTTKRGKPAKPTKPAPAKPQQPAVKDEANTDRTGVMDPFK